MPAAKRNDKPAREGPPRRKGGGRPPLALAARISDHVLETALEEFSRRGVEATSMDLIASTAHVSKRTIYDRFSSKEALLSAALEHAVARYVAPITASLRGMGPGEALTDMLAGMLEASARSEAIAIERLMLWARDHDLAFTRAIFEQATGIPVGTIASFLKELAEARVLVIDDFERTARILFEAAVIGPRRRMMLGINADETAETRRNDVAAVVGLFLGGHQQESSSL